MDTGISDLRVHSCLGAPRRGERPPPRGVYSRHTAHGAGCRWTRGRVATPPERRCCYCSSQRRQTCRGKAASPPAQRPEARSRCAAHRHSPSRRLSQDGGSKCAPRVESCRSGDKAMRTVTKSPHFLPATRSASAPSTLVAKLTPRGGSLSGDAAICLRCADARSLLRPRAPSPSQRACTRQLLGRRTPN